MASTSNVDNAGWLDYVELYSRFRAKDDEYVSVPIFPAKGILAGNSITATAQVARALAGLGTPGEVQEARNRILAERAKKREEALHRVLAGRASKE